MQYSGTKVSWYSCYIFSECLANHTRSARDSERKICEFYNGRKLLLGIQKIMCALHKTNYCGEVPKHFVTILYTLYIYLTVDSFVLVICVLFITLKEKKEGKIKKKLSGNL